jgi:membrane protein required for colicin V production
MNTFDVAVLLGLAIAMGTGFSTGLIRSAITIVAYIAAMPIAVWVMSFVPPLTENYNSPLMQNAGFFLGAFLVIGMVIGKLARIPIDEAIGTDIGLVDRLGGATLGAVRVGLVATSIVLVFDQLIPSYRQPALLQDSQLRPFFSAMGQKGVRVLPPELTATIERLKQRHKLLILHAFLRMRRLAFARHPDERGVQCPDHSIKRC